MSNEQSLKVSHVLQIVVMLLIAILGYYGKSIDDKLSCIDSRLRSLEITVAAHTGKTAKAENEYTPQGATIYAASDSQGVSATQTVLKPRSGS